MTVASHGLTFKDLLDDVVVDYRKNKRKSIKDLTTRLDDHVTPYFGDMKPSTITASMINRYVVMRQGEKAKGRKTAIANGTINCELTAIERAFRLAMTNGRIATMPMIEMLRGDNVRTGFFELEQLKNVRRHLSEDLQPMVTLAYITGWRMRCEIWRFQWPTVDFNQENVRLEVGSTKTGKGRGFLHRRIEIALGVPEGEERGIAEARDHLSVCLP